MTAQGEKCEILDMGIEVCARCNSISGDAGSSATPYRAAQKRSRLSAAELEQYEGRPDPKLAEQYLNPDQKATDDSDVKYEHPSDLERPEFHPMPAHGFVSDPCGPFYDPKHGRQGLPTSKPSGYPGTILPRQQVCGSLLRFMPALCVRAVN